MKQYVFTESQMKDLITMYEIARKENDRSEIKNIPVLFSKELLNRVQSALELK